MDLYIKIKKLEREVCELKKILLNGSVQFSFLEIVETYPEISSATNKRFVLVITDETNNNDTSLYLYTDSNLKFLQTVA